MSINRRATARGPRYDVRLRTPDGEHLKRTFRTRKEAEAWSAGERVDRDRGAWVDPRIARRQFADVVAEWMKSNPAKRSGTLARDESVLRLHILDTVGARALNEITTVDVQNLVNVWCERSKPRTVDRHYDVLRSIFNYAVECDYLVRSPCRGIKLPLAQPFRRDVVDADGLARLIAELPAEHAPIVLVAVILGLRWGECAGLRVRPSRPPAAHREHL